MNDKIYYGLWMAHPVLQSGVVALMLWKKHYRRLPMFFAYVASQILIFAILFPAELRNYDEFFYLSRVATVVSVILGFKVIHEVFLDVLNPYPALRDFGSVLFRWTGLVMLLAAGVVAISSTDAQTSRLVVAIFTLQRSIRVMQCGLVLFLLLFSTYLGITWRSHSFGVALGFGGFAFAELTLLALQTAGLLGYHYFNLLNMITYNLAILVWFTYLLQEDPARRPAETLLRPYRWNETLLDMTHPLPPESLLPMFEGMVDRAFSRSGTQARELGEQVAEPQAADARPARPHVNAPNAVALSQPLSSANK